LPHLPGIQKENDPETQPAIDSSHSQRSQPYISLASTITIILPKSTFVPKLQLSPRIPIKLSQVPHSMLLAIQLQPTHKPSPYTPTNNHLSSGTLANNVSYNKLPSNPTKNRLKQSTPPPPQNQESTQQATNFPTFRTIHTITGGSNLNFENKRQK
jgi:hypothetical protein